MKNIKISDVDGHRIYINQDNGLIYYLDVNGEETIIGSVPTCICRGYHCTGECMEEEV